jgi:hypothetical protein
MISEAIDKVLELAPIQVQTIGDHSYIKAGQQVTRLRSPDELAPKVLPFSTLTGLAEYIEANPDDLDLDACFLHVATFERVELLGPLQPLNDNDRFFYAAARAGAGRQGFAFGQWLNLEDFIIKLQADFAEYQGQEDDREAIIDLLGKVANENLQTMTDNGFSQTVQVKSGLTTLSAVKVENPVTVRPWRTFAEIEQPPILAVLRFRKSGDGLPLAALFESGGGAWKLEAMTRICAWLKARLADIKVLA